MPHFFVFTCLGLSKKNFVLQFLDMQFFSWSLRAPTRRFPSTLRMTLLLLLLNVGLSQPRIWKHIPLRSGGEVGIGPLRGLADALVEWANPMEAASLRKRGPLDVGVPIKLLGATTEQVRSLASTAIKEDLFSTSNAFALMEMPYHEHRLLSLYLLQHRFDQVAQVAAGSATPEAVKAKQSMHDIVTDFLIRMRSRLHRWTLIDAGVPPILGVHVASDPRRNRHLLYSLVYSDSVWERRAALLGTFHLLKLGDTDDFLELSKLLIDDPEYYVQTAIGLCLRDIGRRKKDFLLDYVKNQPGVLHKDARAVAVRDLTEAARHALYSTEKSCIEGCERLKSSPAFGANTVDAEITPETETFSDEMTRNMDSNDAYFQRK